MQKDSASTYLSEGMYFNANILDSERQRITGKPASQRFIINSIKIIFLIRRIRYVALIRWI